MSSQPKRILFHRDFQAFTGGHLKVWHYFEHVRNAHRYRARIAFSHRSRWDATNPWLGCPPELVLPEWSPDAADVLFLAGEDWQRLPEPSRRQPPRPVINLIQHVRHADPEQRLYRYLEHPAIRVCVSQQVSDALRATGRVNGPLTTIPNGLDWAELPAPVLASERALDLLVVGIKQPDLAARLAHRLAAQGWVLEAITRPRPRAAFLRRLGQARIALLLPHRTEGFYLPALEAFALETLVICPDVIGNRDFCRAGVNCVQPAAYTEQALVEAAVDALALNPTQRRALLEAAAATAASMTLAQERAAFLRLLDGIDGQWARSPWRD